MALTAFRRGPTYRGAERSEQFEAAFDQPMSIGATLFDQAAGGVLQSFGLGTVIRDFAIPQGAPTEPGLVERALETAPIFGPIAQGYGALRDLVNPPSTKPPLTAEEWKTSPYFRSNIPYDASMTEDRAAALAIWDDARKVREFYAEKRPITSFIGNLAGQALDPINYIPVAGPAVKGAAALKFGHVLGGVAAGALDAAANTAVAGFATAGERGQYGDDVSWQAQISEIATAALIGGAFGGIGGFFSGRNVSRATAEAAAKTATLARTQEARVALNDAAVSLSLGDDVVLSGTAKASVERVAAVEQARAVSPTSDAPRVVVTPDGRRAEVRTEIVDARDLVAASGDLQPRDRSRQQSDVQIEDIAINLDPARLMFAPETDRGAPIVGPDNVVESGNGRRAALIRAAEAYPERFEAYKQALREAGFKVPNEGVPILVSRRVSPMTDAERVAFVTGSNTSAIARMSATEAALTDVRAMTDDVVASYVGGDVKLAGNRDFVRGFLARLPTNEAAALVDADGALNADGVRRLENGLVAAAYGDPDLVARFAEATDNNAKSITGALSDVAGEWTRMRRAVQAGEIEADLDLTPNVLGALRLISRAREQAALQGRPVSHLVDEAVRQIDMMEGPIDPRTEAIVQLFYGETYARAKSRDDIAIAMRAIVAEVEAAGRPQLFDDAAVSGMDIVNAVSGRAPDQRNMFDEPQGNDAGREGAAQSRQAVQESGVPRPGEPATPRPLEGATARIGEPLVLRDLAPADQKAAQNAFLATQPARSLDELYAVADQHQAELGTIGTALAQKHGADFRNPGIKKKATSAEKMARKRYDSTSRLTDVVRAGYVVQTPDQVDGIVADLARQYPIVDEGWRMTAEAYFDRKVMVQFPDGTIGEVQFWHPDLLEAKDGAGHAIYEEMRALPEGDPRMADLRDQQRQIYLSAIERAGEDWLGVVDELLDELGASMPGNISPNRSGVRGTPESSTSSTRTDSQAPASDTMASAALSDTTAGRPSQSKNSITTSSLAVNDNAADAAARVGKPESIDELAATHGIDPTTGGFLEQMDIEQIRAEGRLRPEDELALREADEAFENAEAWGRALDAAVRCVV